MLMNTKEYTPQVYRKEREFQVFTSLMDIIFSNCKYDIDNIGDLYDAKKCKESFLPLLGYTLNYKYNYSDTVSSNRSIINTFAYMEKRRGSEVGLKMATALSLTSLEISQNNAELITVSTDYLEALSQIEISYDYEQGQIIINYPKIYTLVRYLLDYVRPVGMRVLLKAIVPKTINPDTLLIYANAVARSIKYNPDLKTQVNKSFVNFSGYADSTWISNITGNEITENETIDMNGGD